MKGSLHTDELMRAVTSSTTGLRTARRISRSLDVPTYPETLFITDAAINIFRSRCEARSCRTQSIFSLMWVWERRDSHSSAVKTVTSKISTIEAAALCRWRTVARLPVVLDGPLAFDNAIDPEAAKIKGIKSRSPAARRSGGSRSRGGQHAGQEPDFPCKGRCCGTCSRRAYRSFSHHGPIRCGARMASCAAAVLYADARVGRRACRDSMDAILVVNAGSSSLKFRSSHPRAARSFTALSGQMDGIGTKPRLRAEDADKSSLIDQTYPAESSDLPAATQETGDWLRQTQVNLWPSASGGSRRPRKPSCARTPAVVTQLERYVSLAPLHQPNNLAPIRALLARRPELPQVACFDTAFHRGHSAWRITTRFRKVFMRKAYAVTVFTAFPTSMLRSVCAKSRRRLQRAG